MQLITIGQKLGRPECPYMKRWVINFFLFSLRIHHWLSSDDDRNFHDHPWGFITFIIKGGYVDVSPLGEELMTPGKFKFRPALHRHTVKVNPGGCWTLMITGPELRKWGFWVKNKFIKANKYFFKFGHHPCS